MSTQRKLPYNSQPLNTASSTWGSGYQSVTNSASASWATGDSWGGLSTGTGLEFSGSAKSSKFGFNAGESSYSSNYVKVSGSSFGDGKSVKVGSSGSKSGKGSTLRVNASGSSASVSGAKSNKESSGGSKSGKGSGLGINASSSGFNGMYVSGSTSVSSGKSDKTDVDMSDSGFHGVYVSGGSVSGKPNGANISGGSGSGGIWGSSVQPINPVEPSWNNDGHTVQVVQERGKWTNDGWTAAVSTPDPTPRPTRGQWNNDGFVPVETPPPTFWKGDAHPVTPPPIASIVTPAPTSSPTTAPTPWKGDAHPLVTPPPVWKGDAYQPPSQKPIASVGSLAPTACDERMVWHPNSDYTICSNDSNYPSDSKYIYESLEMCCMMMFGKSTCSYEDICNPTAKPTPTPVESIVTPPPSPAPTSCEERMWWHPNPGFTMCTNDSMYPANWATPEMFEQYFHESLSECCMAVFGLTSCQYNDICVTPMPSTSPVVEIITPAPVTSQPTDAPTNAPTSQPTTAPTEAPTDAPTPQPTDAPTDAPTPQPTNAPTDAPTSSPVTPSPVETIVTPPPSPAPTTCEERKWYVLVNGGELVCSNSHEIPSGWMGSTYYYDSVDACCASEFGQATCEFEDICNPVPVETPVPTYSPTVGTLPPVEPVATPPPTESTPVTTNSPVSPAPTPCEARVAYFDGTTCSNAIFIGGAASYSES